MLTLVVPSYNRHYFLNRIFNYYANSDIKVIIVDGSPSPLDKTTAQSLPKNITYCYDKSEDPVSRMAKVLHLIDTPYACLMSDDELHLRSTLEESVRFLETHKDYSSCIGLPVGFQTDLNGSDIKVKLVYPEFKNHTVDQDQFPDRLTYHFNSYTASSVYGVLRTPEFKIAIQCCNIRTSCVYTPEITFELATAVLGKLHILQKVSWLRCFENPAIITKNWNRKFRFHHWFTDPKYNKEKSFWISELCKLLNSHTQLSISELKKSIESALNYYIEKSPQDRPNKIKLALSNMKIKIKGKIKSILKINKIIPITFEGSSLTQIKSDLSNNILNLDDFDYAFSILKKYPPQNLH